MLGLLWDYASSDKGIAFSAVEQDCMVLLPCEREIPRTQFLISNLRGVSLCDRCVR